MRHSAQCHPARLAVLACMACAKLLPAQVERARQILERVIANPRADSEGRYALLIDAYRLAAADKGRSRERSKIIAAIKGHLNALDPHAIARLKAQSQTALGLLRAAESYQEAGWNRTARQVLELALMLDPYVQPDQVASLRKQLPDPNQTLLETFDGAIYPYGGKPWAIGQAWIASPSVDQQADPQSHLMQAQTALRGDYGFSLEVLLGNRPGSMGIAVGMTGRGEKYHMVQLEFSDDHSTLSLHSYHEGRFFNKVSKRVPLSPKQRSTWIPIHIRTTDGVLSASIAEQEPITWKAEWPLDGNIGLIITGFTRNPDPVRFRHLRIDGP